VHLVGFTKKKQDWTQTYGFGQPSVTWTVFEIHQEHYK